MRELLDGCVNKTTIIAYGKENSLANQSLMINIDSNLAKCFDSFLSGRTDKLPSRESIINFMSKQDTEVISQGYGYTIFNDLKIEHYEPINKLSTRIDVIEPNDYYAFTIKNKNEQVYKNIDVEEDPIFDINRIEKLQFLLKNCISTRRIKTK